MKIIETDKVLPKSLKPNEREWVYNGLDCCITSEVLDVLLPQLDNNTFSTYSFSKALQGPVLEMRLRGVLVDKARKAEVIEEYHDRLDLLERSLERIVGEGIGFWGFNWRSNSDLKQLFYDELGIPVIKKMGRVTCDRAALEKMDAYFVAKPIVQHIMAMRDLGKKLGVLKAEIDRDGRYRTSYNIAGTNSFRFSSSMSEFGTGGNMQNVEELLRRIFISDPGYKFAYFDAEQIQSRIVGAVEWNLFKDAKYLDACESGDLHTTVSKLCEPRWPWTGHIKEDKKIAEKPYYRHHSLRKLCKSIGHGTNFMGKPFTLDRLYKVGVAAIGEFQKIYMPAFPAHAMWHEWTRDELASVGQITALTGQRRHFFGRRDSEDTLREALAYEGQASESKIVNTGMLNVWRSLKQCMLMMQTHDAITVQYPEEIEDEIVPQIKEHLVVPVELKHGRTLIVPYGAKTGWNWGIWDDKENPEGLKEYIPGDQRRRSEKVHILDRVVR